MKNIYTAHGFHFYKGSPIINWLLYFPVEFFLAKKSDAIITINTEDYKLARKMFRTKIYHVSGVGIQYNNYSSKAKSTDTNVLRIVSVGELNRNKNHISVINALSTIQFPYEFNIAGEGPLRKKIMKIIEIQNTSGSIHLLGHVNHINIILQNSDLFIMPSLREGLPVSIMEAMASGLPVVASNIRGIRDLVDEGRGGFLYNPSDKRHLLRLMTVLANDHQLRNSMGSYNRNRALQFDFENINKEMEKIYSEIFR
jgi:glycosyltransferase involved in cell wall biosynthesis